LLAPQRRLPQTAFLPSGYLWDEPRPRRSI
jgi:hypothetical protein